MKSNLNLFQFYNPSEMTVTRKTNKISKKTKGKTITRKKTERKIVAKKPACNCGTPKKKKR